MTMTDVEIGHARPARSPDTKAAINYLIASGATAISIAEIDGVCSFHVGSKIDPRAVTVQWLPETNARAILKLARKHAGKSPDAATAGRALAQAAADQRVVLTPHDVARRRSWTRPIGKRRPANIRMTSRNMPGNVECSAENYRA
jgi:hypothetical protein